MLHALPPRLPPRSPVAECILRLCAVCEEEEEEEVVWVEVYRNRPGEREREREDALSVCKLRASLEVVWVFRG